MASLIADSLLTIDLQALNYSATFPWNLGQKIILTSEDLFSKANDVWPCCVMNYFAQKIFDFRGKMRDATEHIISGVVCNWLVLYSLGKAQNYWDFIVETALWEVSQLRRDDISDEWHVVFKHWWGVHSCKNQVNVLRKEIGASVMRL